MIEAYVGIIALCLLVQTLNQIFLLYFQSHKGHMPDKSGKCRICGKDIG